MIHWLPDPGMRTVQMHENLFIWNNKRSNIYTALSSIVPAELIDTPFIYRFLLITRCSAMSAWFFCVSLFVLLGHSCQNLFISFCGYLLVKIMPHSYIWIPCDRRRGRAPFFLWREFWRASPVMVQLFLSQACIAPGTLRWMVSCFKIKVLIRKSLSKIVFSFLSTRTHFSL